MPRTMISSRSLSPKSAQFLQKTFNIERYSRDKNERVIICCGDFTSQTDYIIIQSKQVTYRTKENCRVSQWNLGTGSPCLQAFFKASRSRRAFTDILSNLNKTVYHQKKIYYSEHDKMESPLQCPRFLREVVRHVIFFSIDEFLSHRIPLMRMLTVFTRRYSQFGLQSDIHVNSYILLAC